MKHIKCHSISQVSAPANSDVPRLIWVSTGELYADLAIAGQPTRIRISDLIAHKGLPADPRDNALYFNNGTINYYTSNKWCTIATIDDLQIDLPATGKITLSDIAESLFDPKTGLEVVSASVVAHEKTISELQIAAAENRTENSNQNTRITSLENTLTGMVQRLEAL